MCVLCDFAVMKEKNRVRIKLEMEGSKIYCRYAVGGVDCLIVRELDWTLSLQNGALGLFLADLMRDSAIACLSNHSNDIIERTFNIDTGLGRSLCKIASQDPRHLKAFIP